MGSSDTVHASGKEVPSFNVGDTVAVETKVVEGDRERVQSVEGVVIRKRGHGENKTFTVRRVSHGEGVERIFPLYSPIISKIEVLKKGRVRRAKLYYLRKVRGRKGRIEEARGKEEVPGVAPGEEEGERGEGSSGEEEQT